MRKSAADGEGLLWALVTGELSDRLDVGGSLRGRVLWLRSEGEIPAGPNDADDDELGSAPVHGLRPWCCPMGGSQVAHGAMELPSYWSRPARGGAQRNWLPGFGKTSG